MINIYTLTMVQDISERGFYDTSMIMNYTRNRCIGFYQDCDDVLGIVLHDSNIWENDYYQYACIENVCSCTHPIDFHPLWIDKKGNIIKTPKSYKNICCIGIG